MEGWLRKRGGYRRREREEGLHILCYIGLRGIVKGGDKVRGKVDVRIQN